MRLPHDITVVIPTIPPRAELLQRAVASVVAQTLPVAAVAIAVDRDREGAATTRQRALDTVQTEWVAFLDDDDEMMPHHLETLARAQRVTGADVIVPWFEVVGGTDPFPANRYLQFEDPTLECPVPMHSFGITCLVRRECLSGVRFARTPESAPEDWLFWNALADRGASFYKVPQYTWLWYHHGRNTSGLPVW